jgi:protease-4
MTAESTNTSGSPNGDRWERKLLEQLALESLAEQRHRRRWGIFFRFAFLLLSIFALAAAFKPFESFNTNRGGRHTALIDLRGTIETEGLASADNINAALQAAFEDSNTVAVVLRVNSPGGSPVQAGAIYDEIRRLRAKYPDTPLYTVVEEICASGGYYVAAATDRIFVDKASIVGSIGVLMDGFGFVGTMDRVGVERRLMTAGENKAILDPFLPVNERQRSHVQKMLDEIHQQFIAAVRQGRGDRLKDQPELFSGLFWTGQRSIELGLADELGTVDSVARDVIKEENVVDFSPQENVAERLVKRFGASAGRALGFGALLDRPRFR